MRKGQIVVRETSPRYTRIAGITATVGFVGVAGFQAALALGAPFGRAAWGGADANLPTALRVGSAFAMVFWLFAALVVARRAGLRDSPLSATFVKRATWVLFALSLVGAVMNLASRSALERAIWSPVTLVLAALTFLVARAGPRS